MVDTVKESIYRKLTYILLILSDIYNKLQIVGMYSIFTHIHMYKHLSVHHNNYSFKSQMNNIDMLPRSIK